MAAARLRVSIATPDSAPQSKRGSSRQARDAAASATKGLGPWLARVAPARAKGDLSIAIVSDRRMRALNRQFRGKDAVTDVLSFPSGERGFMGDIVVAAGVAKRQAKDAGHSVQTELRVLALHGLLHLLGYDHETDDGRMARAEARLRKKAGLREGLIERAK
ncbi:MAG TPA: rRNA maturation RNase YbeY [Vicinamibacterales bacterium]